MASAVKHPGRPEQLDLGAGYRRAFSACLFVGGAGLLGAILIGYFSDPTFKRFYFAYLVSFLFFLSLSLGALFFVLIQHVTRAGWSVALRRIAETMAAMFPVLLALSAPIVVSIILQQGELYPWARPVSAIEAQEQHESAATAQTSVSESLSQAAERAETQPPAEPEQNPLLAKRAYLNPPFFLGRLFLFFAIWSGIGLWYWRKSVEQDSSGDPSITVRMQTYSAPAIVLYAITVTLASFDLIISLNAEWYSTIFGVYYFGGCAMSIMAALIIVIYILQKTGYLTESITIEHYHDLGKFLFAFVFFWGYIAFSQYMLLWYGNIPEETGWYAKHGATTVAGDMNGWTIVCLLLLFGHLLIPFAGLLSRHVKRSREVLVFWAVWLLVFHWIDQFWMAMPELDGKFHFGVIDILCLIGIGGIYVASMLRLALRHPLRPVADPRLQESLAFQNI